MSRSIVKKALEMLDDDDVKQKKPKLNSIKKKKNQQIDNGKSNRKQLAQTCSTLKKMSTPVVSSDQIEQLNNYRFGGPASRDLQRKKKKEENIFTDEDFKRFEREYNIPLIKS